MNKIFMPALAMLLISASPLLASESIDASVYMDRAMKMSAEKKYDDALSQLQIARQQDPENIYVTLAEARVLSWAGRYAEAQSKLDTLYPQHETNGDVQLVQGYLYYYQGQNTQAEKVFADILARNPGYTDAREGLALAQRSQQQESSPEINRPPEEVHRTWQIDAGFEYSHFSRVSQDSWNQEFTQLTHFSPDRSTALHGKVTRYDQFTNIDSEYEVGIDHLFYPWLVTYLYGAFSPEADFRPDWRVMAGGGARFADGQGAIWPIWLVLDVRRDEYEDTDVVNINPGIRVEPADGWAVTARAISVDQSDEDRVYGNEFRLDGQIVEGLRFTTGYADAPETVAGVTVDTRTYYGGVAYDITPLTTIRVNYTHDDRDGSWERDMGNVSVSYRF